MKRIFKRYKSDDGQKRYCMSFCAYFDILGFSEKIKNENLDFFNHYLKVLNNELDYLNSDHDFDNEERKRFEMKIFTDNFVIGYPWNHEDGEIELGDLFDVLSHIQLTFAQKGIFIKGAISHSNLYMDNNIVIGPALIESYKLEESSAIYPRIILSENAISIVNQHINYYSDDFAIPQKSTYLIDKDGCYFLNYLYLLIANFDDDNPNYDYVSQQIRLHKNAIEKELESKKINQRIFDKFSWCAEYHNYFCDNFLHPTFYNISQLKVKKKLFERNITKIQ
ncbi:MAG: hypothetical protein PHQ74_02665 [Crocinitomicaceae bacterium]|nr:hypothetical protein [Crocinitomicaceae bacterium]